MVKFPDPQVGRVTPPDIRCRGYARGQVADVALRRPRPPAVAPRLPGRRKATRFPLRPVRLAPSLTVEKRGHFGQETVKFLPLSTTYVGQSVIPVKFSDPWVGCALRARRRRSAAVRVGKHEFGKEKGFNLPLAALGAVIRLARGCAMPVPSLVSTAYYRFECNLGSGNPL